MATSISSNENLKVSDLEVHAPPDDFEVLKKLPPRISFNNIYPIASSLRNSNILESTQFNSDTAVNSDHLRNKSIADSSQIPAVTLSVQTGQQSTKRIEAHSFPVQVMQEDNLSKSKQMDLSMRSQIEDMKITYIEQYMLREEKLKQELAEQIRNHEAQMIARENHWSEVLSEKEKYVEVIIAQHQREISDYKKRLQDKDEFYIGQMSAMEKQFQQQQIDLDQRWKERVKVLQDQINMEKERQALTEKAKIEAKEASLQMQYEKKVKKYTKQIESVMEHYKAKELMIQGALDEARREIINLQANYAAMQQVNKEELLLKDKRLIEIQQYLGDADETNRRADEWKTLARDLAAIVIQACATVEELPAELWTSTTPGLFTSVWDDLRGQQTGSTTRTGFGKVSVDDTVRSYSEKKKDCVVANRAELAKCLKYSKIVHDRIRLDDMRPLSPSQILS